MDKVEVIEFRMPVAQLPVVSIGTTDIGRIFEGEVLATEDGYTLTTEAGEELSF